MHSSESKAAAEGNGTPVVLAAAWGTRNAARMHAEHVNVFEAELSALPARIGGPILAVWNAKEDLLALARTEPDRERFAELLYRFYRRCANAGLPELERLATAARHGINQNDWRRCDCPGD